MLKNQYSWLLISDYFIVYIYTGHYPIWDDQHPIHVVGHSAGAQVIRVLQQMLADKVPKLHFFFILKFNTFDSFHLVNLKIKSLFFLNLFLGL